MQGVKRYWKTIVSTIIKAVAHFRFFIRKKTLLNINFRSSNMITLSRLKQNKTKQKTETPQLFQSNYTASCWVLLCSPHAGSLSGRYVATIIFNGAIYGSYTTFWKQSDTAQLILKHSTGSLCHLRWEVNKRLMLCCVTLATFTKLIQSSL